MSLVSVVAAAGAATAQVERTGLGIRLLDAPAARMDDPRARGYIVDHVSPGTSFTRRVEVINDTGRRAEVRIYPAAAATEGGTFDIAPGASPNELTGWMRVTPSSAVLEQGARQTVTVSISVPTDAAPGERYGAVMAELPPTQEPGQIKIATRVGIRTYLSVGPGAEPASDFAIESLTASRDADGTPQVEALVRNTGGRALDMQGELVLQGGPGGLSAGPFPAEVGTTIGLGGSAPVLVRLDDEFPSGPWTARLTMRSGLLERAAEATITFPEGAGQKSAPAAAKEVPLTKDIDVVGPVAVGVLGLVSLMLLFAIWWLRRRKKNDDDEDEQPTPTLPVQRRAADEQVSQ